MKTLPWFFEKVRIRLTDKKTSDEALIQYGAGRGIRTPEGISQQIYSLPCLTASLPLHMKEPELLLC